MNNLFLQVNKAKSGEFGINRRDHQSIDSLKSYDFSLKSKGSQFSFLKNQQQTSNKDQKEFDPTQNSEYFEAVVDEFGNLQPPPQAMYDYYDENYYYEMVVPDQDTANINQQIPDDELYRLRQKRDQTVQELAKFVNS